MSVESVESRKRGYCRMKNTIHEFTIEWTIDNFIEWVATREGGVSVASPIYKFDFMKKELKFSIEIIPRGRLNDNIVSTQLDGENNPRVYLRSNNEEALMAKLNFRLLNNAKKKIFKNLDFQSGAMKLVEAGKVFYNGRLHWFKGLVQTVWWCHSIV